MIARVNADSPVTQQYNLDEAYRIALLRRDDWRRVVHSAFGPDSEQATCLDELYERLRFAGALEHAS